MPDEKDQSDKRSNYFDNLRDKAVDKAMPDEVPEYRLGESVDPAFTEREARRVARPDVQMERLKKTYPDGYPGYHTNDSIWGRLTSDIWSREDGDIADLSTRQYADHTQAAATRRRLPKILQEKGGPLSPEDLSLGDWETLKRNPRLAVEFYEAGILGPGFYDDLRTWVGGLPYAKGPAHMPDEDDTTQTRADTWKAQAAFEKRQGD